ncbi:hypothetical protein Hrd1104_06655 [Halorhabdus sp. CBA1104]|uniref:polymer-forming cytoskeletal protein n=1 Tax=unclassified Halorhabdus TaxID=2621901 RepID=UPI0012B348C8|nr:MULTISPECIES: polymer-forming cytoskeletal protein [unclassified Halorhabdus]QGN07005.1 hypothetical protein Hrd1104_06655 [Halorhabdus sp. CBA1104]
MSKIEETRAIVDEAETYEGAVIPTGQAEIERPVTIHEDATVTDGVYGQAVTIEPGATIDGPVMAKEGVEVDDGSVNGDVGTPGSVSIESGVVSGTVMGSRLRLVDTTVVGNVVASEAILENCTVIGTVVGEQRLRMESTTCYTFKSYIDSTFEDVNVLLPQAIVDGSFSVESPIEVRSIRRKDQFVDDNEAVPILTEDDARTVDGTTYLTLVPRLLDVEAVETRIDQLESFLRAVALAQDAGTTVDPPAESEWVLDAFDVTAEALDFSTPT